LKATKLCVFQRNWNKTAAIKKIQLKIFPVSPRTQLEFFFVFAQSSRNLKLILVHRSISSFVTKQCLKLSLKFCCAW